MKTAVEIAKQVLGPKHVSQQIDSQWRGPLEQMAKAVLEVEEHVKNLEAEIAELKKPKLQVIHDDSGASVTVEA